jgi:hypothetical protein
VRGRRETHDQEPGIGIAEAGYRFAPVVPVAELALPDQGDLEAVRAKAAAVMAGGNGGFDSSQRTMSYETLRVFRFMKSIRINCPSVIVLVKYAFPRQISSTLFTKSTRLRSRASMNVLIMIPLRRQLATSRKVSFRMVGSRPIEFT